MTATEPRDSWNVRPPFSPARRRHSSAVLRTTPDPSARHTAPPRPSASKYPGGNAASIMALVQHGHPGTSRETSVCSRDEIQSDWLFTPDGQSRLFLARTNAECSERADFVTATARRAASGE